MLKFAFSQAQLFEIRVLSTTQIQACRSQSEIHFKAGLPRAME